MAETEFGAYRVIGGTLHVLMRAIARYEWSGLEHLPRTGGFIAAANHASELDSLTLAEFLHDNGYHPRILAKRGLFNTPVVGAIMRNTGMIPVDRGSVEANRSLAAAADELRAGACVALFPEGTLTRDPDLWPMEGKTGVARLALSARVPVIPVGQWGAGAIWGRYERVPRLIPRKTIRVTAGPPVDLTDLYDVAVDGEVLREATSRVMDAISDLVSQLRGEPWPRPRFDLRLHPDYKPKKKVYPPLERP